MKKQSLLVSLFVVSCVALLFGVVYATQQAPDTTTMNSTVYEKHTKPVVTLSHKKHNVDYGISCADCHHVYENGKNVWKEGDAVEKCQVCHSQAKAPKAKPGDPKLSKVEKIKLYHYSAIH
ncbi:MAG: cytochrome c3 family protein, partial [Deltaproteobacteria bacterium]|nr:cytochrome c3 family protein [Deltaproteobacteria bacterium]